MTRLSAPCELPELLICEVYDTIMVGMLVSSQLSSANGANNIAVLIPCHRVVQADGSIGGYAYGPEIKRELLAREGSEPETQEELF